MAKVRRRLALPVRKKTTRHHHGRPPPTGPEPATPLMTPLQLLDRARRDSVDDARTFLRDFIRSRWSASLPHARVECRLTMAELRDLGRLRREEGAVACRRLVSVPVVHDELGLELWKVLAGAVMGPRSSDEEAGDGQPRDGGEAGSRGGETAVAPECGSRARRNPIIGVIRRRPRSQQHQQQEEAQEPPPSRSLPPEGHRRCVFCRDDASDCCSIPDSIRQAAYQASGRFFGDSGACPEGVAGPATGRSWGRSSGAREIPERVNKVLGLDNVSKIFVTLGEGLAYGYGGIGGSPIGRL